MTPRALLTSIGATAIAFAIAIGSVASITPATTTTVDVSHGQATRTMAYSDVGTGLASGLGTGMPLRTLSAEDDCPVAL